MESPFRATVASVVTALRGAALHQHRLRLMVWKYGGCQDGVAIGWVAL